MIDMKPPSVYRRRSLFVWALFCALAGVIFLAYACASLMAGHGEFVMPLDDVYIHFQYAKQMALGQPYVYNPGLSPTSGATSFLYPYMLAVGYLLGFQGLNLGLWAMLLGMVALACSSWLVYRLLLAFDAPHWLAVLVGMIFAISGPVSWHFMSGMETGWVVLFTLGTLYFVIPTSHSEYEQKRVRNAVIFGTLLALIRPEGGILAGLAMVTLFVRVLTPPPNPLPASDEGEESKNRWRRIIPVLIPILAIGVQPLVNLLLTGSAVASGNAAKSVLGAIPFYWDEVIRRILDNFVRLWTEFFTGSSPREGLYITPYMLVLAAIGLIFLLRDQRRRVIGLMLIGWLAAGTLAISTLDTAFWHFKRYQMPFMALLFPLAGWGLIAFWGKRETQSLPTNQIKMPLLIRFFSFLTTLRDPIVELFVPRPRETGQSIRLRTVLRAVIAFTLIFAVVISLGTGAQFLHHYGINGLYVYQQPLQMARWLEANTPPDAVIAVHDVGMMRYMGGRTTLDMVGLTTPGAADYWRNGPGSVAEFLIQERPDYIASYGHGHGFGLGMLADTSLYGEPLASFPVDLDPNFNVALAANFQGIYQPDWDQIRSNLSLQPYGTYYWGKSDRGVLIPVDAINVGNIDNEKSVNYSWQNAVTSLGFPTEVHELDYVACAVAVSACHLVDGGRLINGEEAFDLRPWFTNSLSGNAILVTRVNPQFAGMFDVYANDTLIGTRIIPAIPGKWLEIPTLIPEAIARQTIHIRIVPHIPNGFYVPYYHWSYRALPIEPKPDTTLTTFQDGAIVLAGAEIDYEPGATQLGLNLDWYTNGSAQGDYKVFVHILDENDQIVAQADTYPGNGTLPPGNWLPGVLRDTIVVDLKDVPPGIYRVAIGMYDPYTFERLQPAGGDDQNRFFIGDVEIK